MSVAAAHGVAPRPSVSHAHLTEFRSEYFEEALGLLSGRELQVLTRFSHPIRRMEWTGARVLAKFMYLRRHRDREDAGFWARVDWEEMVAAASRECYRAIHVLAPEGAGGAPEIFDADRGGRYRGISLAHKWPVVAAGLSAAEARVGMDIERVTCFSGEFQAFHFRSEQALIASWSADPRVQADRLCTLLWVLKESFIKSYPVAGVNLWEVVVAPLEMPRALLWTGADADESIRVLVGWRGALCERTAHLTARGEMIGALLEPESGEIP